MAAAVAAAILLAVVIEVALLSLLPIFQLLCSRCFLVVVRLSNLPFPLSFSFSGVIVLFFPIFPSVSVVVAVRVRTGPLPSLSLTLSVSFSVLLGFPRQ